MRKQLWVRAMFPLVLLFSIVLGACGSPAPQTVTIGVRTANDHVPFYIADRQGSYEKLGLDVEVRLISSNTEIIEALQRGDFQVGAVPVTTAIAAIAQGIPLRIVAMTGRGSDGILVRSDGEIADLSALEGKRIATIRASILDVLLRHALEQAGLDPDSDVELVYMSKLGDLISALQTGQVEAISNTEPFMTDAERQGWGHILTYYTASWPDHPCCVVVARERFIADHPQALEGILRIHCEAADWANAHREETAQIIVDYLQAFDPELVSASLSRDKMSIDYRVTPEEIERMAELMAYQGLIKPIAAGELVDLGPLSAVLRER